MITILKTIIKLRLFDSTGAEVNNYPVRIKYYQPDAQSWFDLYDATVTRGSLFIQGNVDNPIDNEPEFFDLLSNGQPVPIIILPVGTGIAGNPIVAARYFYTFSKGDLEYDLGTYYLAPADAIAAISGNFTDFLPVASMFPFPTASTGGGSENAPVPIQDLYSNIVSEIATATQSTRGSAFKLSNISLKLKAFVHGDGESMSASLLSPENSENANGEAISELVFDITPVQDRETTVATMPDVTGLTETAVRKILKTLGLKLNAVYQNKPSVVNGDSFKQSPAEGTAIQPNQLITVIFSKHE